MNFNIDQSIDHIKCLQKFLLRSIENHLDSRNINYSENREMDGGSNDYRPVPFNLKPSTNLKQFISSDHYGYRNHQFQLEIIAEIREITRLGNQTRLEFLKIEFDKILEQHDYIHEFAKRHQEHLEYFKVIPNPFNKDQMVSFFEFEEGSVYENYYSAFEDRIVVYLNTLRNHFPNHFNYQSKKIYSPTKLPSFEKSPFVRESEYEIFIKLHKGFNVKEKIRWTHIYNYLFEVHKIQLSQEKFFGFINEFIEDVARRRQEQAQSNGYFDQLNNILNAN